MRLPDVVLGAVVYIGVRQQPGFPGSELAYKGSGFIVSVEHRGITFYYLVTADHVAKQLRAAAEPVARLNHINDEPFETEIYKVPAVVRESLKERGIVTLPEDFWQRHPDPSVDLAVLSFTPWDHNAPTRRKGLPPIRGITHIPEYMMINDAHFGPDGIGVGDEVYIAGMFRFLKGERSLSPILRLGSVAMIPRERVNTKTPYGAMEAYLIEARSIGGLSGAPVFVRETVSLDPPQGPFDRFDQGKPQFHGSGKFYLLGIAQGHWDVPATDLNNPNIRAVDDDEKGVNVGIAIVTPARKLWDIIHGEYFTRDREDIVSRLERNESRSTMDSVPDDPPTSHFERSAQALFQVPKAAVDEAEARRPKHERKKESE